MNGPPKVEPNSRSAPGAMFRKNGMYSIRTMIRTPPTIKGIAPPAAKKALEARLIRGFAAGGRHNLAVVQDKEQGKDRDIDAELAEAGCVKGLEERPDEPEVRQKRLLADKQQHIHVCQHTQNQQRTAAEKSPAHFARCGGGAESHALPAVLHAALFVLLIADDSRDQHDENQKRIPAEEAVADRHAEDVFRQWQEAVAELRHERIRRSGEQHRDDRAAPPRTVRLDGGLGGQRLYRPGEERRCEQQLHHGHERCDCREHGAQHERLLRHGNLIRRRERLVKTDGVGEPRQRRGKTVGVVGRETVVGVQKLHAAGRAVFEASVGRVPCGLVRSAAEKLRAQVASQKAVVHDVFVVAEVAELIVFCLQKQDVVKVNVSRIISTVAEQFAALQNDGLRFDVRAVEIRGDRP